MCLMFRRWVSFLFAIYFELQFDHFELFWRMLEHLIYSCHSIGHPVVLSLLGFYLVRQFGNHDRVVSANVGIPHSIAIRLDTQLFFIMIMYSRPRPRRSSRIIMIMIMIFFQGQEKRPWELAACFFMCFLLYFSFLYRDYDYDDDLSIFAVGGMVERMRKSREKDAPREDIAVMPRRNRPRRSKPSKIEDGTPRTEEDPIDQSGSRGGHGYQDS